MWLLESSWKSLEGEHLWNPCSHVPDCRTSGLFPGTSSSQTAHTAVPTLSPEAGPVFELPCCWPVFESVNGGRKGVQTQGQTPRTVALCLGTWGLMCADDPCVLCGRSRPCRACGPAFSCVQGLCQQEPKGHGVGLL